MRTLLIVIAVHLALILWLGKERMAPLKAKKRVPVTVKTLTLQERPAAPSKPAPQPTPKPKPAPEKKAPKPKEKETPPKKTQHDQVLALMEKSLNQLDHSSKTKNSSTTAIGKLASESTPIETDYADELIAYLEQLLTLPEKGEVKLKLTVERTGKVTGVAILNAASPKNTAYLETKLPTLSLPSFGSRFPNRSTQTFPITLFSD